MEWHDEIEDAIRREKAVKKWRRAWKIELIETINPNWDDLYDRLNS
jgi:putative endonuclease